MASDLEKRLFPLLLWCQEAAAKCARAWRTASARTLNSLVAGCVSSGWRVEGLHLGFSSEGPSAQRPGLPSFLPVSRSACLPQTPGRVAPSQGRHFSPRSLWFLPATKASLNSQAAKLASSKTFLFSPSMSSSVCNVCGRRAEEEDVPWAPLPALSSRGTVILGSPAQGPPPSPAPLCRAVL